MTSLPHIRRAAFFTTANASGRTSFTRRASSSLSVILESSSFHAAVFWRRTSADSFCSAASIRLISSTLTRMRLTSRSFLEPTIFLRINPIMRKVLGKLREARHSVKACLDV
jgi:hypothetical protein